MNRPRKPTPKKRRGIPTIMSRHHTTPESIIPKHIANIAISVFIVTKSNLDCFTEIQISQTSHKADVPLPKHFALEGV